MLSPSNNELTNVLEQANKLFKDGMYDWTKQNQKHYLAGSHN